MSNPYVREVASVRDLDEAPIKVGVDYDTVTIGLWRLTRTQCEDFARAFTAACWEAADNSRLMQEEADTHS